MTAPTVSRPRRGRSPLEVARRADHVAAVLEIERARLRASRLLGMRTNASRADDRPAA